VIKLLNAARRNNRHLRAVVGRDTGTVIAGRGHARPSLRRCCSVMRANRGGAAAPCCSRRSWGLDLPLDQAVDGLRTIAIPLPGGAREPPLDKDVG